MSSGSTPNHQQFELTGFQPRKRTNIREKELPQPLSTKSRELTYIGRAIARGHIEASVGAVASSILYSIDRHNRNTRTGGGDDGWVRAHQQLVKALGEVYEWEWDGEEGADD